MAVRLAVDLGLHSEDGREIEEDDRKSSEIAIEIVHPESLGQRQWMRDLRRRLWWCVYSFDRLVRYIRPLALDYNFSDAFVTSAPALVDHSELLIKSSPRIFLPF